MRSKWAPVRDAGIPLDQRAKTPEEKEIARKKADEYLKKALEEMKKTNPGM